MQNEVELKVVLLDESLPAPSYMTPGAAGMDLFSTQTISLNSGEIKLVPTGIKVAVPPGYELQIRPRSGLATEGIGIVNSPGTVDSDYRGEIKVCLVNFSKKTFLIRKGDRIAQAVLSPVIQAKIKCVSFLDPTSRGEGGFGHTGR